MQYIKLKKELNKESQEAGWFFCPPDQKVWCAHAGIFKAFPVSFTAQSVPMAGSNCEGAAAASNCSEIKCKAMNRNPE